MNELKRVIIHARWQLHSFTLLAFLLPMIIGRIALSEELLLAFISWVMLLSGLTIYNSYYDKDKGPAIGLEVPPEATTAMLIGAWGLKIAGLLIALFLNKYF